MHFPSFVLSFIKIFIPCDNIIYMHYKLSWSFFYLDPKQCPSATFKIRSRPLVWPSRFFIRWLLGYFSDFFLMTSGLTHDLYVLQHSSKFFHSIIFSSSVSLLMLFYRSLTGYYFLRFSLGNHSLKRPSLNLKSQNAFSLCSFHMSIILLSLLYSDIILGVFIPIRL